ncbi:hypothetical protein [Cellulosimicrobium sp. I38E]|uniref:hypothetical protein n=1 Tax=Cellulosimicrobium sp. I38E TaxID=1393139 RepID=UPI0007B1EEBB|nr:hypothetical protein [Cellulosimicrobium sp. I38E]KZM78403.1 hypothetical protein A0J59_13820 [Cellulosimicrobium sp. I38E]
MKARLPSARAAGGIVVGWPEILGHWRLVVADLARLYGVDLTDPATWRRPWPPLRSLILTLPSEPTSRLHRALGGD